MPERSPCADAGTILVYSSFTGPDRCARRPLAKRGLAQGKVPIRNF
ncbi:hypothetical protein Y88_2320 [Novosphingobium nitrogenifigens DSM 19370]|uniref:Uncharacterized protein n=1 Tax=Novosphingobium nitrogenifigens DSM 19370 TaxID=983920 RepID=F1Z698_9SPHN|nr:hypothetical protein Y88_2320 [Novosphingobium nitrogenifigens DSM 19370]